MKTLNRIVVGLSGIAVLASSVQAQVASYRLLGTYLRDVSDDGQTLIGMRTAEQRGATTWTPQGGFNAFGQDPNLAGTRNIGMSISGDGTTYFGNNESGSDSGTFRYRAGQVSQLGWSSSSTTLLFRSSSNGQAACGRNEATSEHRPPLAILWTNSGGYRALFMPGEGWSEANDITSDGGMVVGYSFFGAARAWTWSLATQTHQVLPTLAGMAGQSYVAKAVSSNGRLIVGFAGDDPNSRAVIWRDGVISALAAVSASSTYMIATSVSDDGSIVLGQSTEAGNRVHAVIWVNGGVPKLLSEYFHTLGLSIPDAALHESWRVSANGRTLYSTGGDGGPNAWVVTIPAPSGVTMAALAGVLCVARRRR